MTGFSCIRSIVPPDQIFELPVVGAGLLHVDLVIFHEERRWQHVQAFRANALRHPDRGHPASPSASKCIITLYLINNISVFFY